MAHPPSDDNGQTFTWVGDQTIDGSDALDQVAPDVAVPGAPLIAHRYRDLGPLGAGGMGEVRRVWDARLRRTSAMKIMRLERRRQQRAVERFVREAHTTGRLQHPGIVPVYDMGQLPDGRWWFTMKEVLGTTFGEAMTSLHAAASPAGWPERHAGPTFRRLVDTLLRVCQTMAYAHAEGFVHRDLKPDNLMLGQFGEVMVLDWGLGKLTESLGTAQPADDDLDDEQVGALLRSSSTLDGGIVGSPPYMAPEQARGDLDLLGPAMDVYALGAVLYHLLAGGPPYRGSSARDIVEQVRQGPPLPVARAAVARCPQPDAELARVCERAMARDPAQRFSNAGELGRALEDWLDGTRRLEEARAVLLAAAATAREVDQLALQAQHLRDEAEALLAEVPEDAPEQARHSGWARLDQARALDDQVERGRAEVEVTLQSALKLAPQLESAHERLADLYRRRLEEAERGRDHAGIVRNEALLRAHDRGRHAGWLRAEGRLTLVTDPPGAEVRAFRYVERQRSLVPEPVGLLGRTPLYEVEVPRGSLLVEISAPGQHTVRLPLLVGRGEHLDHVPPGETEPAVVRLPRAGELGPDDIYVPPGWTVIGGDALALDAWPWRRVWIDGFVIGRVHVSTGAYRAFLEDRLEAGGVEAVRPLLPMETGDGAGRGLWRVEGGALVKDRHDGLHRPEEDTQVPVTLVSRAQAAAYARWRAERDGLPWRLPHDLEWERAARGADGRVYPWGDEFVAGRACLPGSHAGRPLLAPSGTHPADTSPFGVQDVAGNARTWCGNPYQRVPLPSGARVDVHASGELSAQEFTMVRGGNFSSPDRVARAASRFAGRDGDCWFAVGFRLARSLT